MTTSAASRPQSSASSSTLRRQQTITLALLFIGGVVNYLDRSSLSIANTTVRAEMHLNATQMGWLFTTFPLAYGLAQLPMVGLLDRAGTRTTLGAGLSLWSVAQMLTGLVRGLPTFLPLRFLLGAGEAPWWPAGVRTLRDWFSPRARARATSIFNSSNPLASALAPPLLTCIMLWRGWRAMFVALGVAGMFVAAAWFALHREAPVRQPWELAEEKQSAAAPALGSALRILLRRRMVWGMMLGWGGVNYTVWLYLTWLPGYLEGQRHLSVARSGWVAAIPFLAGAAGMYINGIITDTLGRRGFSLAAVHRMNIIAGMTFSAVGTFVVAHSATTPRAVAGLSIALFCIHSAGVSGWGYVQAVAPHGLVGSLAALQNFASFMIASAAPVLTGWLLDKTHSFTIALGVCSAVTLLGALSYATLARPSSSGLSEPA
ncbi:MAG TPA: MFS transporter [Acidobacteriaceae bacterium]|nr:MFS transporter [Acidobacteriaceae bacterium]